MRTLKNILPGAAMIFLIFTLLCGVLYTGMVTGFARFFRRTIKVDGVQYGRALLGQYYTGDTHMRGAL